MAHSLDEFVRHLEYLGDVACVTEAVNEGHGMNTIRALSLPAVLGRSGISLIGQFQPVEYVLHTGPSSGITISYVDGHARRIIMFCKFQIALPTGLVP